jgi:hypothetical protein
LLDILDVDEWFAPKPFLEFVPGKPVRFAVATLDRVALKHRDEAFLVDASIGGARARKLTKLFKLAVPLQDLRGGIHLEPACWAFPCLRLQDAAAVPLQDLRGGIYLEPACWAFPCLRLQDAAAFRTKLYGRDRDMAVPVVALADVALVEFAASDIGYEPEALMIDAAMVCSIRT